MIREPALRLGLLLATLAAGGGAQARDRFVMATDHSSRYGFRYVQDRETGLWVHLHCEIRVPLTRKLPDPITSHETGDLLHFTEFGSGTMGSAGVDKNEQEIRDGYRVWLYRVTTGEDHYKGAPGSGSARPGPTPARKPATSRARTSSCRRSSP
jgi:hypothetical protein